MTLIYIASAAVFVTLGICAVCYFMAFYSPARKDNDISWVPKGKIYEPYRETFERWGREVAATPCRECEIVSRDGLKLRARYYSCGKEGALTEIMLHGYRGSSMSDLCGGVKRAFSLGHNVLLPDHRASGRSEGHTITFGVKESLDCLDWVDYLLREIDPNARIILTGISMGASTVMLAVAHPLPENVVGALADCGYSSAEKVIKKVIADMKLPPMLVYPFVRLSARLFGGFDPDDADCESALKSARVPVIFFHTMEDAFVPYEMSVAAHAACSTRKALVLMEKGGHGLACPVDTERYIGAVRQFFGE
jgi:pimeloyl-ACP methyl ester carboxylesterase